MLWGFIHVLKKAPCLSYSIRKSRHQTTSNVHCTDTAAELEATIESKLSNFFIRLASEAEIYRQNGTNKLKAYLWKKVEAWTIPSLHNNLKSSPLSTPSPNYFIGISIQISWIMDGRWLSIYHDYQFCWRTRSCSRNYASHVNPKFPINDVPNFVLLERT